jgi:hypothetical protein
MRSDHIDGEQLPFQWSRRSNEELEGRGAQEHPGEGEGQQGLGGEAQVVSQRGSAAGAVCFFFVSCGLADEKIDGKNESHSIIPASLITVTA